MDSIEGFVKLVREGALELLKNDVKAYVLYSYIALSAKRTDNKFSRIPLEINQAFIGVNCVKQLGLSPQEYRTTKKRLTKYGFAKFKPTNRGTVATLTSQKVFDINADQATTKESADSSMKNSCMKQLTNTQGSIKKQIDSQQVTNNLNPGFM